MNTSRLTRQSRPGRRTLAITALLMTAGLSAGCSNTGTSDVSPIADATPMAYDSAKRHPIMISEEPEVLDIRVGMNGPALSPQIERAIRDYVRGYKADGTGMLTIQTPTESANEVAAASTGRAVHYALVRAGVPHGQIDVVPYHVGDHAEVAKLRLSYLRVKAVAPQCGLWPEAGLKDYSNKQYHNFGCAAQQNLAAMVADPGDFVRPQPMTPAHGGRRAKVIVDYSQGAETRSATILLDTNLGGQ